MIRLPDSTTCKYVIMVWWRLWTRTWSRNAWCDCI